MSNEDATQSGNANRETSVNPEERSNPNTSCPQPDREQRSSEGNGLLTLPPEVKQEEIEYIINRRKAARWAPIDKDEQKTQRQANGGEKGKKSGKKGKKAGKEKISSEESQQEEAWEQEEIRQHLVGLALSGGGIRSATFSLGVLQELAKRGLLPLADYLCTVSGGGYVGSCLSSLMSLSYPANNQRRDFDPNQCSLDAHSCLDWKWGKRKCSFEANCPYATCGTCEGADTPRFDMQAGNPLLAREQIHHLRKHGDFVMVRQGLLRRETLRSVAWFLIGLLSTLTVYAFFVLACAGLFVAVASWLGGIDAWSANPESFVQDLCKSVKEHGEHFTLPILTGILIGLVTWLMFAFMPSPSGGGSNSEIGPDIRERNLLVLMACFLPVALIVMCLFALWPESTPPKRLFGLCLPLGFVLGLLLALLLLNILGAPRVPSRWNRGRRSLLGGAFGVAGLFLIATLLLPTLVWTVGLLTNETGTSSTHWRTSIGAIAAVSLAALRLLLPWVTRFRDKPGIAGMVRRLIVPSVLSFLVLLFVTATFLLASCGVLSLDEWVPPLLTAVLSFAAFVVAGLLIDFNRIGPHYFYRDRLVEAYLQTQARVPSSSGCTHLELVRNDEHLRLQNLLDWAKGEPNPAPYHLIQCAINLAGSRDLARRNRMSDHFVFSREFCGSSVTGYVRTCEYRDGKTKLANAMTLSGAAAGSGIGFRTSFAQAFAATLFNIRLGSWLVNPRIYEVSCKPGNAGKADSVYHSLDAPPCPWAKSAVWLPARWQGWIAPWIQKWQETVVFWPFYLACEMLAMTDAESALVNLSDGGHTGDNIGLYPLLQRRCKLILAVDGEADPNYDFGSLAAGISQIFIDEHVSVKFNLDALRPDQGDRAKSHYLIGKITYPPCPDVAAGSQRTAGMGKLEKNGGTGWIIYLKSSLTHKAAPAAVTSYAAFNKEFPHQSTLDQFFDDDQFEAYRALGEHIASTVFKDFRDWCQAKHKQGTAPDDFQQRVRLLDEWAEYKFNQ